MCYPIKNSMYADIYGQILTKFKLNYLPENENIATILCSKGFKFSNFEPSIDLESLINLYKKESPFDLICNDKIDELQSKYPNLDVNMTENKLSLIDCACRHGSEKCFNFLRDKKPNTLKNRQFIHFKAEI